jgi:transposase-like protein
MSPKKLSEADKNEILRLYRHSPETTSTLATHFGVSSSTVSRFLKSNLPEAEYETLIQQKRAQAIAHPSETVVDPAIVQTVEKEPKIKIARKIASDAIDKPKEIETADLNSPRQLEIEPILSVVPPTPEPEPENLSLPEVPTKKILPDLPDPTKPILATPAIEIETDSEEELDDDFDEDWEDDEVDEEEEASLLNLVPVRANIAKNREKINILPLSAAILPKVCYLVVDRAAELIARPLRDFSDLGSIPDSEVQEKTLPVFPNHRVAMRFSNRSQRVIKVPDSGILQKTSPQLQAKGITRLLVNGQVYSLSGFDLDD